MIGANPEEFSGRVEVEVDTPSSLMHLGTVHLCAAVGTASLHAPSDLQVHMFKHFHTCWSTLYTSLVYLVIRSINFAHVGSSYIMFDCV